MHTAPALRDRREDIGLLVAALLRRIPGGEAVALRAEACEALLAHDWPRNVRELAGTLQRAMLLATDGVIEAEHLELPPADRPRTGGKTSLTKEGLVGLLEQCQGNLAAVARRLATSRSQVHRHLKRHELRPDDFRR